MNCTIEAKILPLVGLSGHLYLEVFDETGLRISQINGLATDSKTGKVKSIGVPSDVIKVYISRDDGILLGVSHRCNRDNHGHKGCVLFEGAREEVDDALDAMRKRAAEINFEHASYRLLSLNSNTVFSEMVRAAQKVLPLDLKALSVLLKSKVVLPGVSTDFNNAVSALKKSPKPKPPQP